MLRKLLYIFFIKWEWEVRVISEGTVVVSVEGIFCVHICLNILLYVMRLPLNKGSMLPPQTIVCSLMQTPLREVKICHGHISCPDLLEFHRKEIRMNSLYITVVYNIFGELERYINGVDNAYISDYFC